MTKRVTSRRVGLKALNDIVIIEEDDIEYQVDNRSGLTTEVVQMVKDGKLVIPDIAEFYAKKYPCTGTVKAAGSKCKNVAVGNKVLFARQGGLRETVDNTPLIFIREIDVHAILD